MTDPQKNSDDAPPKSTAERRIEDVAHSYRHLRGRFGLPTILIVAVLGALLFTVLYAKQIREGLETLRVLDPSAPAVVTPVNTEAADNSVLPQPPVTTSNQATGTGNPVTANYDRSAPKPGPRNVQAAQKPQTVRGEDRTTPPQQVCSITGSSVNDSTVIQDCSR